MLRGMGGEKGQVIVLIALMLPMILGMAGLVHDVGRLLVARRATQAAADSAAYAAAIDLASGSGAEAAVDSALLYAAQNGFDNDGTSNTVAVSIPPTSGSHAGDGNYAQVRITVTPQTLFVQLLGARAQQVSTSATAGAMGAAAPYSLLALHPSACPGLSGGSSGNTVAAGSVMVNSNCGSGALRLSSSGDFTASWIGVTGTVRETGSGTITPAPTTGVAPVADPLAALAPPSFNGLTVRHGSPSSPSNWRISSSRTLYPGIYYGGVDIRGSAAVTMQPGTYIMAGGGFKHQSSRSLTGDGVFIYNTQDPDYPGGDGAYGEIDLRGSGGASLTAPDSGPYRNLLFFHDRSNTRDVRFRGSGGVQLQGTIYAPSAPVTVQVSGGAQAMQVICGTAAISGSSDLNIDYDGSLFYSGSRSPALVE